MGTSTPSKPDRHLLRWSVVFAMLAISTIVFQARMGSAAQRAATQATIADELDHFEFRGQPIHPACVMQLATELSDSLPVIAAVDLEGCTNSQQHSAAFTVRDGWIRLDLKDGGWFAYRNLGVSPGGTHVLHTQISGGGTGVFEDLLLVRFHRDRFRQDDKLRDRVLMTSVGDFTLGVRDDGSIRLEGNKLLIGRSRYRQQETVVPLDDEP